MANFFSADYWKALYFKAMGGQATAVDPNAMSGSFAGSSSWTGTASASGSSVVDIAGSFAGSSEFTGDLRRKRDGDAGPTPGRKKRKQIRIVAPSIDWVRKNVRQIFGGAADLKEINRQLDAAERSGTPAPEAVEEILEQAEAVSETPEIIADATAIALADDDDEEAIIALLLAA